MKKLFTLGCLMAFQAGTLLAAFPAPVFDNDNPAAAGWREKSIVGVEIFQGEGNIYSSSNTDYEVGTLTTKSSQGLLSHRFEEIVIELAASGTNSQEAEYIDNSSTEVKYKTSKVQLAWTLSESFSIGVGQHQVAVTDGAKTVQNTVALSAKLGALYLGFGQSAGTKTQENYEDSTYTQTQLGLAIEAEDTFLLQLGQTSSPESKTDGGFTVNESKTTAAELSIFFGDLAIIASSENQAETNGSTEEKNSETTAGVQYHAEEGLHLKVAQFNSNSHDVEKISGIIAEIGFSY